jgi:hypothetical protein
LKSKGEIKIKRKGKVKRLGWIIALVFVALLCIGGAIGWIYLSKEHNEAKNLPLNGGNFSRLNDGVFIGEYKGGMYKWRENEVRVTVSSGSRKCTQEGSGIIQLMLV